MEGLFGKLTLARRSEWINSAGHFSIGGRANVLSLMWIKCLACWNNEKASGAGIGGSGREEWEWTEIREVEVRGVLSGNCRLLLLGIQRKERPMCTEREYKQNF